MQLEIHGLTKTFAGMKALDALDLTVCNSGSLAIIGPSGGGKTTLLRILGGLELPDSGTVTLNGRAIDFTSESALMAHRRKSFYVMNPHQHLTQRSRPRSLM